MPANAINYYNIGKARTTVLSVSASGGTTNLNGVTGLAVLTGSANHTFTLPAAVNGDRVNIKNRSTGVLTINRAGSDTIDGGTSVVLAPGDGRVFRANGTDWCSLGHGAAIEPATLTDAATIAVDFGRSRNFAVTLAGNRTLGNPTNVRAGQEGRITVTQDGTGGRTLAFADNWKYPDSVAPTTSGVAGAVDVFAYYAISSTSILIYRVAAQVGRPTAFATVDHLTASTSGSFSSSEFVGTKGLPAGLLTKLEVHGFSDVGATSTADIAIVDASWIVQSYSTSLTATRVTINSAMHWRVDGLSLVVPAGGGVVCRSGYGQRGRGSVGGYTGRYPGGTPSVGAEWAPGAGGSYLLNARYNG